MKADPTTVRAATLGRELGHHVCCWGCMDSKPLYLQRHLGLRQDEKAWRCFYCGAILCAHHAAHHFGKDGVEGEYADA